MRIWGNVIFGWDYIAAFIVGFFILVLFCAERFAQPVENESFVSHLLPAHLASRRDYNKAFLVYLFIMLSIYTALSLVGPSFYQAINSERTSDIKTGVIGYMPSSNIEDNSIETIFSDFSEVDAPAWLPLLLMLILSGASTQYKVLNQVELIVRKLTHRIIGIPEGIERLATKISEEKLNVESLSPSDQQFIQKKYEKLTGWRLPDITHYHKTLEGKTPIRRWIRLQFLYDRLENKTETLGGAIDVNVLSYYKHIWNSIKVSVLELKSKDHIAALRQSIDGSDDTGVRKSAHETVDKINSTLHNLHALIAASLASRSQRSESISRSLASLGLTHKDSKRSELINAVIVAIILVAIVVFFVVFFTTRIPEWLGIALSKPYPVRPIDAFKWATGAIFLHGSAAIAAWYHREKAIKTRDWKALYIRQLKIPAYQYLHLVLRCYIISTLSLLIWWLISEMLSPGPLPDITLEMIWIPYFGLIGGFTGFWVSYTMDLTMIRSPGKTRTRIQPFIQAFFTAFLCYFIMTILTGNQETENELFNLYVSAVLGLEGLTIGYAVMLITLQLNEEEEVR